jgi:hypothetical protein
VLVVLVLLVALGGIGIWWKLVRKDQQPVDVAAVEREFARDRGRDARPGEPAPGVYRYRSSGEESVSALGGQTNSYPPVTTLTITPTPCGVDARWDVLTGRYDIYHRCRRANGSWVLTGMVISDRFFNQTHADTYTCDHLVELPAEPTLHTRRTGRCVQGENTTQFTYEVVGLETLTIGGVPVSTVHLKITAVQGGGRGGGGVEHRWVEAGTNLVVRARDRERDTSESPLGEVTYTQRYDLELVSLTPRS